MKKLLFVGVAMAVVAATALIVWAHNPNARWYIGSDLYEVDGVIYCTGVSAGSLEFDLASNKFLIGQSTGKSAAQTLTGDITTTTGGVVTIGSGAVDAGKIGARAVTDAKLPAMLTGEMMVGDTSDSNANVVAMSQDATIDEAGALTIAANAIDEGKIAGRAVTGAKLPITTAGQILAGQADSNAVAKTVGGDATMDEEGDLTIAASAIDAGKIEDRAVTGAKLQEMITGQIVVGNTADSNATVQTMSGKATIGATGDVDLSGIEKGDMIQSVQDSLDSADAAGDVFERMQVTWTTNDVGGGTNDYIITLTARDINGDEYATSATGGGNMVDIRYWFRSSVWSVGDPGNVEEIDTLNVAVLTGDGLASMAQAVAGKGYQNQDPITITASVTNHASYLYFHLSSGGQSTVYLIQSE